VIKIPRERGGHSPRWAAEPEKIIIIIKKTVKLRNYKKLLYWALHTYFGKF
jgi:hypothetical protein